MKNYNNEENKIMSKYEKILILKVIIILGIGSIPFGIISSDVDIEKSMAIGLMISVPLTIYLLYFCLVRDKNQKKDI